MKIPLQIFITITLLLFYIIPSYVRVHLSIQNILIAQKTNSLISDTNKTEEVNCNKEKNLCSDIPNTRNSAE